MRQEVQVYVNQRFEESDEGDRQYNPANFLDSGTGFWEFNYAGEARDY